MSRSYSCSWCHTVNTRDPNEPLYCRACLHRGDLPRSCCDCPMCFRYESPPPLVAFPGATAEDRFEPVDDDVPDLNADAEPGHVAGRGWIAPRPRIWRTIEGRMHLRIDDEAVFDEWLSVSWERSQVFALILLALPALSDRELMLLALDVEATLKERGN